MGVRTVRIAGAAVHVDLGPIAVRDWPVGQPAQDGPGRFLYTVRHGRDGYELLEGSDVVAWAPDATAMADLWERRAVGRVLDHHGLADCIGIRGEIVDDRLVIGPARPGPFDGRAGTSAHVGIITPEGRFQPVWGAARVVHTGVDLEAGEAGTAPTPVPAGLLAARAVSAGVVVEISAATDRRVALRCLAALGADRACRIVAGAGDGARPAEGS